MEFSCGCHLTTGGIISLTLLPFGLWVPGGGGDFANFLCYLNPSFVLEPLDCCAAREGSKDLCNNSSGRAIKKSVCGGGGGGGGGG